MFLQVVHAMKLQWKYLVIQALHDHGEGTVIQFRIWFKLYRYYLYCQINLVTF